MKQRHQPLRLKRVYECTCGVFCGTSIESWLRHADDQKVLNPDIAEFNAKVLTPELYRMQQALRQVGKSFGHIREVYGRAFKQIAEPFRHLTETADLMEEGRRLASERDDLIASGVDPSRLLVPEAPRSEDCVLTGCDEPGTVKVVAGLYPSALAVMRMCEAHAKVVSPPSSQLAYNLCPHRHLMVETLGGQKVTRCLDCKSEFPGEYTPNA